MKELRGNLSSTALPELLHIIYTRGDPAGVLEIDRAPVKRRFFFEAGRPVFATSNILHEVLGRVLLQEGVITRADYERSLEIVLREKKKHGEVLVDLGLVTPEQVDHFLALQLKQRLLNVFGWHEGSYLYTPRETLPQGIPRFPLHPASVILEGISKGFYPETMLRAALQGYMDKALVSSNGSGRYRLDDFGLNLQEKRFYESIDGSKPLREVLEESYLLRQRAESLILSFIITGLLTEAGRVADESGLILRLNDELARLSSLDRFRLFSLSGEEDLDRLEDAYVRLSKKYRPGLFRGAGPEVRELVGEIRGLIEEAYQGLKALREERAGAGGAAVEGARGADARVNAEILFMKARTALEGGEYSTAAGILRDIVELNPGEAEYRAYLGWALFCENPENRDEAEALLKKAVELNKEHDSVWYLLGRFYISSGNLSDGERALRTALVKNPWMSEALYELKRLEIEKRSVHKEEPGRGPSLYTKTFGFTRDPFDSGYAVRDPYRSGSWNEAFGSLMKCIDEGGGPVMLTGPEGSGKTLLALELVRNLSGRRFLCALVLDPPGDEVSFIKTINSELFNRTGADTLREQVQSLNQRLALNKSQNGRTVVIIDEAQKAEFTGLKLLEQLLRNEDLGVVLIGDERLGGLVEEPWLKELERNMRNRLELRPLGPEEVPGYIQKRLDASMGDGKDRGVTFTEDAFSKIFELSRGLPLSINTICRRALEQAAVLGTPAIDAGLIEGSTEGVRTPKEEPFLEGVQSAGDVGDVADAHAARPAGAAQQKEEPRAPKVVKIMKEPEASGSRGLLTIVLIVLAMAAIGLILGSVAGLF